MKTKQIHKLLIALCCTGLLGCSIDVNPFSSFNVNQKCFIIKDAVTDGRIEGATIYIYDYNYPDCITCPIDLNETSDIEGKFCVNFSSGYWYDRATVSAFGYQSRTFDNRSLPKVISLTPNEN